MYAVQTGSGKTYTMGTGYTVGGSTEGVIPKVMETIFKKMDSLRAKADFQIRVSFIEVNSACTPDDSLLVPPVLHYLELVEAFHFFWKS